MDYATIPVEKKGKEFHSQISNEIIKPKKLYPKGKNSFFLESGKHFAKIGLITDELNETEIKTFLFKNFNFYFWYRFRYRKLLANRIKLI